MCVSHRTLSSSEGLSYFYKRESFCHTGNLVQNCALLCIHEINRNRPSWPTTTNRPIVALFIDLAGVLDTVTVGRINFYIYCYVLMCLNIYPAYFNVKIQEININTQHN